MIAGQGPPITPTLLPRDVLPTITPVVVPTTIVREVLTQDNYADWSNCVEWYLVGQDLWEVCMMKHNDIPNETQDQVWKKKNAMALHAIQISCCREMLSQIRGMKLASEAWDFLKQIANPTPPPSIEKSPTASDEQSSAASDEQSSAASDEQSSDERSSAASDEQSSAASDEQSSAASDEQSSAASDEQSSAAFDEQSSAASDEQPPAASASTGKADFSQYEKLVTALERGCWQEIKLLIENPEAVRAEILPTGETALDIAVEAGHVKVVKELVQLLSSADLKGHNYEGLNLFQWAAVHGFTEIAECMYGKNQKWIRISDEYGDLPVVLACNRGRKEMTRFLYSHTPPEKLKGNNNGASLLSYCIVAKFLDIALEIIAMDPRLVVTRFREGGSPLDMLAQMPSLFNSGSKLWFWQRWIYSCITVNVDQPSNQVQHEDQPSNQVQHVDQPSNQVQVNVDDTARSREVRSNIEKDQSSNQVQHVDQPSNQVQHVDQPSDQVQVNVDNTTHSQDRSSIEKEIIVNVDQPSNQVQHIDQPSNQVQHVDQPSNQVQHVDQPSNQVQSNVIDDTTCSRDVKNNIEKDQPSNQVQHVDQPSNQVQHVDQPSNQVQSNVIDDTTCSQDVKNNIEKVLGQLHGLVSYPLKLLGIKNIHDQKLRHAQAIKLLQRICTKLQNMKADVDLTVVSNAVIQAVEEGNVEFVTKMIKSIPKLVWEYDENGRDIFAIAILKRQEKIFDLFHGLNDVNKKKVTSRLDEFGNNMLHLVAKFEPLDQVDDISGAALLMQRELQWFKEVESILPPVCKFVRDKDNKTPSEVFSQQHENLVKKGEKWMKEIASSSSVVAALIVTIMFAAAFTIPGGNSDKGTPIFLEDNLFMVFIMSDAISLFSATTSVLMFLGILTSQYAENKFLTRLPTKLIIGLSTLFISITTMMIAFCATLAMWLKESSTKVVMVLIILLACVPVIAFALLQFPLLVDVFISTYGPSIFNRKIERWY